MFDTFYKAPYPICEPLDLDAGSPPGTHVVFQVKVITIQQEVTHTLAVKGSTLGQRKEIIC